MNLTHLPESWYPNLEPHWETRVSFRGHPVRVWIWKRRRMPRISDDYLRCVFYLYPSVHDATEGERVGGTGFLIEVRKDDLTRHYAVTNAHLIEQGATVIRLNTKDGEIDPVELVSDNWIVAPNKDDVAVCPIELNSSHDIWCIPLVMSIGKGTIKFLDLGIGDDVYMVGRYIDHEGREKNRPAVRFGNISMMPDEPVYQIERKHYQESYVVEMRSLPGYSGSPVFAYVPTSDRRFSRREEMKSPWTIEVGGDMWLFLLGIDWGHFTFKQPVRDERKTVDVYSAMTGVVPAWQIESMVYQEFEEYAKEMKKKQPRDPMPRTALDSAQTEKPFTKEDFEKALRKASKPKSDEEKKDEH